MPFASSLKLRRAMFVAIAVLWMASLALPAVQLASGATYDGFELLRRGWSGVRADVYAWYANPAFWIATLLGVAGHGRSAGVVSGIALLLGLTSVAAEPLAHAAGMPVPEWSWRAGFYVWLAALFALCAWSWAYVAYELQRRADAA